MTEDIIKETKRQAMWKDELNRRTEACTALDFYNYRQHDYLLKDIATRYPNENADIQRYMFTAPLTQSMIRQLAVCFKNAPALKLTEASEVTEQAFIQALDNADFYKKLKSIDKYTELTGKVGAIPRWNGSKVIIDIITPDKCYVIADDVFPTEPREVGYTIGQTQNHAQAKPVNIYAVWTADEYREESRNDQGSVLEVFLTAPNLYNRIPIVWFEIDLPLDTFWLDQGNPFVELNRRINLQLTNLDIAIDFQSFSTLVTKGLPDIAVIPVGVTRRLNLPSNSMGEITSDAAYITPDAKLETVWKIIQESIKWFAGAMGISAESIDQGSNFSSGFQLILSKQGVIDRNVDKQDLYREPTRDLAQLIMDTNTIYGSVNFPTDAIINVDFADITVMKDPLEQEAIIAAKMSNGTLDPVGALMLDNPDLTKEDAIAEIAEMQARKQTTLIPKAPSVLGALGLDESSNQ
jgi:hypothetical protein